MIKTGLFSISLFAATLLNSQVLYDFSTVPLANGWTYYDDYSASPYPGFEYDAANQRIDYQLNTSVDISLFHRQLPSTLSTNYCVSFKITPTDNSNYNSFFPLILTPYEVTGTHLHPWRQNALGPTTAGPIQNIDFLAVEAFGNELRFFNRDGNIISATSIQSMTPQFEMQANYSYWVKLEIINSTSAKLSVFQDAGFNTELGTTTYTIPALDDMNHLYLANCNGNSATTQFGQLDEYGIDRCSGLGIELLDLSVDKTLVKIVDLMGRETEFKPNIPLIYIYSDGSTEKSIKFD